ncbi:hypothetical protein JT328_gp13 [Aeromonas phage BUCT551]|uniref:Uncharacterized protein n=1 Tax=Aeromonas phage BUCT551 TaxID=2776735 RepID=A0A7L8ZJR1_9CAUD|nr:hypothetical protein JT328_gp13 [Aeromonas phage BUCT551]QOI69629.1 hypothetical protein [Aeromonas phage BUCT551]
MINHQTDKTAAELAAILAAVPAVTHAEIARQAKAHGVDLATVETFTATSWIVGRQRENHTMIRAIPGGYWVETFEPLNGAGGVLASVRVEVAK